MQQKVAREASRESFNALHKGWRQAQPSDPADEPMCATNETVRHPWNRPRERAMERAERGGAETGISFGSRAQDAADRRS